MTAKERYNSLIEEIESTVTCGGLSASEIAVRISRKFVPMIGDLGEIMRFLSGETLVEYIRKRQYNAVYEYIVTATTLDLQKACFIPNLQEQSSLNRAFKRYYGITPTDAFTSKDFSKICPPKTWEVISQEKVAPEAAKSPLDDSDKIFGIDRSVYERITAINNLKTIYGLNGKVCDIAVRFSDEYGVDLEDAFAYIEALRNEQEITIEDKGCSLDGVSAEMLASDWLWNQAIDPSIIYCHFQCNISVSDAIWVVGELRDLGLSAIPELSPRFIISFCAGIPIHSGILRKACDYFDDNADTSYTDEDFAEFIDLILSDYPIETAFERMVYEKACDEAFDELNCASDFTEDNSRADEYMEFEAWAEQECGYHLPRFNKDYDPDNLYNG